MTESGILAVPSLPAGLLEETWGDAHQRRADGVGSRPAVPRDPREAVHHDARVPGSDAAGDPEACDFPKSPVHACLL